MENRLEKISDLILLESLVYDLEDTGMLNIHSEVDRMKKIWEDFNETPIEKIMHSILYNIGKRFDSLYGEASLFFIPQEKIGKYRVDFCSSSNTFNINTYIIECDGHDFHEKTKKQASYDKERERYFVKEGYKVLRYSGSDIYNRFQYIEEEISQIFMKEFEEHQND